MTSQPHSHNVRWTIPKPQECSLSVDTISMLFNVGLLNEHQSRVTLDAHEGHAVALKGVIVAIDRYAQPRIKGSRMRRELGAIYRALNEHGLVYLQVGNNLETAGD